MRMTIVLAACCLALPVAAQSLKPGLWELTNRMGGNQQLDQAMTQMQREMAAMPAEQRRQMEAMLSQRGMSMPGAAAGGGVAMRMCMTAEMAKRDEVPMQEGCRVTSQSRSGNTSRMAMTCTNPPSSSEFQVTFHGPESYSSKGTVRTVIDGRSETVTLDGTGKWLAADCGSIRPPAAR